MANPVVTITSPTSNPAYQTAEAGIELGGTVTDADGDITGVSWTNQTTSDSGFCFFNSESGIWGGAVIPLAMGENIIEIVAVDALSNEGSDTITVTRIDVKRPAPLAIAIAAANQRRRRRR
ncbi:MAG: hypothetical protein KF841_14250 [Phycisphaerae bacterium]|nr:hypothetical protein [Phycisphaerae bacterium]